MNASKEVQMQDFIAQHINTTEFTCTKRLKFICYFYLKAGADRRKEQGARQSQRFLQYSTWFQSHHQKRGVGCWSEIKNCTERLCSTGSKVQWSSVCDRSHNKLSGNAVNNTCVRGLRLQQRWWRGIQHQCTTGKHDRYCRKGAITKRIRWPATNAHISLSFKLNVFFLRFLTSLLYTYCTGSTAPPLCHQQEWTHQRQPSDFLY